MERYFYRRGQRVPVTEVQGVLAVQMDPELTRAPVPKRRTSDGGRPAASLLPMLPARSPGACLCRLGIHSAAGRTRHTRACRTGNARRVQGVGQVYQQPDGHILIGSRRLIVQLAPELSDAAARRELKKRRLTIVRKLAFAPNQFQVEVAPGEDVLAVANDLQESDIAVAAEPEFVEYIGQRFAPTDPAYAQQWQLNNRGGSGGVAGADIAAERALGLYRGRGVRVAVIDNGFDVGHLDLAAGVVGESGFFDAGGTFRQTLTGYPDNSHGTFCAGMVGARHNNGRDGCGSAPECELMLVASQGDQVGTQATLARAVAYAADPRLEVAGADVAAGADVIVSSLGPSTAANWALTTVLENAILFAARQGRRGRGTPSFGQAATATSTSDSTRWYLIPM